ncbi:MAG: PDZ domain-containing protein, partial [Chloroflexi bacterium]|nr:PDZ domain-containing protein [Chloroflexota bacterium]
MFSQLKSRFVLPAAVLVAVFLLSACGDDAEESPTPPSQTVAQPQASEAVASEASAPVVNPAPEIVPPETPLVAPPEVPEELMAIWEAWEFLRREHVDRADLDPAALTEAAIRGMLRTLEDRGTYYIGREVFRMESEELQGNFQGIGAHVQMRLDGKLIIVAPLEGSPAMAAGIKAGDLVLEVDGESIEG